MYFEVFKFIVIFAGYELNPLKQVKYKTIYKMRKVSLALLLCLLCLAGMAQGQKALDLKDITSGRFRPENIQGHPHTRWRALHTNERRWYANHQILIPHRRKGRGDL